MRISSIHLAVNITALAPVFVNLIESEAHFPEKKKIDFIGLKKRTLKL